MALLNVHSGPTILGGTSESDVLGLGADFVVGLVCPDEWTPAPVSVMVSVQGDNYLDLFDGKGSEFTFNVTPGIAMPVDPNLLLMAAFIRLRSGTRDNPVPQEATRRFYIVGTTKLAAVSQLPTEGQ